MATKDKLMRFLQEVRGLKEMNRRNPVPKPSPLFLIQLRSHLNHGSRPRHRVVISVDHKEEPAQFPSPVKITHLRADSGV